MFEARDWHPQMSYTVQVSTTLNRGDPISKKERLEAMLLMKGINEALSVQVTASILFLTPCPCGRRK